MSLKKHKGARNNKCDEAAFGIEKHLESVTSIFEP